MIISHPFRYVYVAVPKTASVSVKELLVSRFAGERHGNAHNVVMPVDCIHYYAALDKIDYIIRTEEIEAGFRKLPFVTSPVPSGIRPGGVETGGIS